MRHNLLFIFVFATFAFACKKESGPTEKTITLQSSPTEGSSMYVGFNNYDPLWATGNVFNVPTVTQELAIAATNNGGATIISRAYLAFTLSKLPTNAQIISAKLSLFGLSSYYTIPQGNLGDNSILIQRVNDNWDQTTVNWNTQPSVTGEGQIELAPTTARYNYDVTDLDVTSLVRAMIVSTPNKTAGFCLRLKNESVIRSVVFGSTRNNDPTKRPKLVIVYKS